MAGNHAGDSGGRFDPQLAPLCRRERQRGSGNWATLAVARELKGCLLAVDPSGQAFSETLAGIRAGTSWIADTMQSCPTQAK